MALLLSVAIACTDRSAPSASSRQSPTTEGNRTEAPVTSSMDMTATDVACTPIDHGAIQMRWDVISAGSCPTINPSASVALGDLNGDMKPDSVVALSSHIVALDGATGNQLWTSTEEITAVTVPWMSDLNADGTTDLIIGGRGLPNSDRPLIALNGRDGRLLWRIEHTSPSWQNFYTPQPVGDVDNDGILDVVVTNGGDHIRQAYDRPSVPGRIVVVSGRTGSVLGVASVPATQEVYSSPVVVPSRNGADVLFGAGGEYFKGSLWRVSVSFLLGREGAGFEKVLPPNGGSYIAPVAVGGVTSPQSTQAAVLGTNGRVSLVDLAAPSGQLTIWTSDLAHERALRAGGDTVAVGLASPALAQMDDDAQLEVIVHFSLLSRDDFQVGDYFDGQALLLVMDGVDGSIEAELDIDATNSVVSPLVFGVNGKRVVLCACVSGTKNVEFGIWDPTSKEATPLGFGALPGPTPAMQWASSAGPERRVLLGLPNLQKGIGTSVTQLAIDDVSSLDWGGYMGTDHSGWSER